MYRNDLMACAQKNDAAGIRKLVEEGVNPSVGNSVAQTALHVACLWGNIDAVKTLLSLKSNVDAQNEFNGGTPLHCAAGFLSAADGNSRGSVEGSKECVRLLVNAGANIEIVDFQQKRLLGGPNWDGEEDDDELLAQEQVPVTILTGFLGSGKTTLLNYILKENHGMKIAVVENEFGEVGVDDALIKTNDAFKDNEVVFDMANGCVCCTVRGDLIEIFRKLRRRKDRFDRIIVETTGMADPAPVCQTFFVDKGVRAFAKLDAVITVVDAKHIVQHLDEIKPAGVENESVEQIAFADRVLLNKVDLATEEELASVEQRIRGINAGVQILRTSLRPPEGSDPKIDLAAILDVDAFNLQKILASEPDFLSEEGHAHEHDKSIGSVGFRLPAEMNVGKLDAWIRALMEEKGTDLYRYKGVHMIFDGDFTEPWGPGETRESRFCFIGKNLDRDQLTADFMACAVRDSDTLRFAVGDRVLCRSGGWANGKIPGVRKGDWASGTVEKLWDEGRPYRVKLDKGASILVVDDAEDKIKAFQLRRSPSPPGSAEPT